MDGWNEVMLGLASLSLGGLPADVVEAIRHLNSRYGMDVKSIIVESVRAYSSAVQEKESEEEARETGVIRYYGDPREPREKQVSMGFSIVAETPYG